VSKKQYKVLVGLNYGATRREPGDVCSDIPQQSIGWLLEQGCIVEYDPEAEALMAAVQAQIEASVEVIDEPAIEAEFEVVEDEAAEEPVQDEPAIEAELMPNGNVVFNEVEPATEEEPALEVEPAIEEPAYEPEEA
jgi:hypothetical protein